MLGLVEDSVFRDDPELPSWVPDYRLGRRMCSLSNQVRTEKKMGRWNASGELSWSRPFTSECLRALPVEGLLVDIVEDIGPMHGDIDRWFRFKDLIALLVQHPSATYPSGDVSPSEAFWRTMVKGTLRDRPADDTTARGAFVASAVPFVSPLRRTAFR